MGDVPQRLVQAPTTKAFLAAPVNAYTVGDHYLYFQAGPTLTGYMMWGSPSAEDLDAIELLITSSNARLGPHPSLVDGRALDGAPVLVFERMAAFVRKHRAVLRTSLTKLALVHGHGIPGALTAGFFTVIEPPYPVAYFSSLDAALGWMGDSNARALAAELERIRDGAAGRPALLRQLEAVAVAWLPAPTEDRIARELGLSKRTLQRRLTELGTTFKTEVARVTAMRAVMLLETTDDPVGRIAHDLGCSSLSRFTVIVKRWTGATPTEIRARRPRS